MNMGNANKPKDTEPAAIVADLARSLRHGSRHGDGDARGMAHLAASTAAAHGVDPAPFRTLALLLAEQGLTAERRAHVRAVLGETFATWEDFSEPLGRALGIVRSPATRLVSEEARKPGPIRGYGKRVLAMHAAIELHLKREGGASPSYSDLRNLLEEKRPDGTLKRWGDTTISQTLRRLEALGLLDRGAAWTLYALDAPRRSEAGEEREPSGSDEKGKQSVNDARRADRQTHHPRGRRKARRTSR